MSDIQFHPIADCFPMLGESDFQELKEDIRKHGQRAKVLIFQEKILDGRNRYKAIRELGMEPMISVFRGSYAQAVDMVVSLNLRRRHMDREEIRIAAGKLKTLDRGSNQYGGKVDPTRVGSEPMTQKVIASSLGITEGEVMKAALIEEKASSEVKEAYNKREISQGQAYEYAHHAPEKQRELAEKKATVLDAKAERTNKSDAMRKLDEIIEKMGAFVIMMTVVKESVENADEWNTKVDRMIEKMKGLRL